MYLLGKCLIKLPFMLSVLVGGGVRIYVCHQHAGAPRVQKRTSGSLELLLHAVVSHLISVPVILNLTLEAFANLYLSDPRRKW